MADRIRLTGLSATGWHGVLPTERRDGQTFVADVVLHLDTREAAAGDRLDATVDYAAVAVRVTEILAGEPADLIETVAERIAAALLADARVSGVDVVLHKPQAPIPVPFADVAVEIHRDRANPPAVAPLPPAPVEAAPPTWSPLSVAAEPPPVAPLPPAPAVAVASPPPVPVPTAAASALPSIADMVLPAASEVPGSGHAPSGEIPELVPDAAAPTPADRMDARPQAPVQAVLALGSNVGASQDTLRAAVRALADVPGVEVAAVGPLARTAAVGGPEQPDFLNTVVLLRTDLSPRALLRACLEIEAGLGRVRAEHWGPRTLDIDVILHGTTIGVTDDLELPHPRAHERAFVLLPWSQVDPGAVLPGLGGGPVAALAETAPDRDGVRWVNLDWWTAG